MDVLCEWWTTAKEHEGILQFLDRDPAAGNVSNGCLVGDSAEQLTTPCAGLHYAYLV
jgi:hypothetical protein